MIYGTPQLSLTVLPFTPGHAYVLIAYVLVDDGADVVSEGAIE